MNESANKITLTDPVAIRIVELHRQQTGDGTNARTATRIIQSFHDRGLTLMPEAPQPKDRDQTPADGDSKAA